MYPPIDSPTTVAVGIPSRSRTPTTSSAYRSIVKGGVAEDSPNPRVSIVRQQKRSARALVCGAHIVLSSGNACRNTTGGPVPISSNAIDAFPVLVVTARRGKALLGVRPLRQHVAPLVRHTYRASVVPDGN